MLLLRDLSCGHVRRVLTSSILVTRVGTICSVFGSCMGIGPSRAGPSITCFDVRCNLAGILGVCSNNLNMLTNSCLGRTDSDGVSLATMNFLCHCNCFARSLSVSKRRVTGCRPRGFGTLPLARMVRTGNRPVMLRIPCPKHAICTRV